MKLRHHPKLRVLLGALLPWPPLWSGLPLSLERVVPEDAEGGILMRVDYLSPKVLLLTADFQGVERIGRLESRDAIFMAQLYRLLEPGCLGQSLRAVGDLELDF